MMPASYQFAGLDPEMIELTQELEELGGGDTKTMNMELHYLIRRKDDYDESQQTLWCYDTSVGLRDIHAKDNSIAQSMRYYSASSSSISESYENFSSTESIHRVTEDSTKWLTEGFNNCIIGVGPSLIGKTETLFGNLGFLSGEAEGSTPCLSIQLLRSLYNIKERESNNVEYRIGLSAWSFDGQRNIDLMVRIAETNMPLEFAVIECPTVDVAVQVLNEARKRCSGSLSANPNYSRAHRQEENKTHFFARINLFQRDLRAIDRGTATLHTGTTSSLYLVDLVGFTDIDSHYYKTLPNKDKIIVRNRNLQLQSLLQLVQEMASICRNALQYPSRPMEHMQRYAKLLESKALTSARSSKLSKLLAPIIQGNTRTVVLGFVEDSIPAFEHTRDLITQLQYVPEVRSAVYKLEDVPFHDLDFKSHLTVLGPRFDAKLHKRPPPPPQQPQQQQAENTGLIFTSAKEEPVYQPDTRAAEQFRTLLESVQGHHDTSTNATSVPPPDAVNNEYQHSHHHQQQQQQQQQEHQQQHLQQHLQRKQPTASVTATAAMTHHQAAATTTTTTRKTISAQEINLTNLLEDEFDLTNFDRTPQTVSSGSRRTSDLSSRDDGTHSGSISQQLVDDIQRLVPDVAHPHNSRSHITAREITVARDVPRTNVPFSPPRPAGQAASHRDHHHHDQQPVNTSSVSNAASTSAIQHLMDEFHSLMHMVERPASVSSAPTGRPAGIQQASHGGGAASSTTTAASITVQEASVGRLPQEPSRPWPAHHYFSSAPAQSVLPPRSESASPLRSSSTTTTLGHNSHRYQELLQHSHRLLQDHHDHLAYPPPSLVSSLEQPVRNLGPVTQSPPLSGDRIPQYNQPPRLWSHSNDDLFAQFPMGIGAHTAIPSTAITTTAMTTAESEPPAAAQAEDSLDYGRGSRSVENEGGRYSRLVTAADAILRRSSRSNSPAGIRRGVAAAQTTATTATATTLTSTTSGSGSRRSHPPSSPTSDRRQRRDDDGSSSPSVSPRRNAHHRPQASAARYPHPEARRGPPSSSSSSSSPSSSMEDGGDHSRASADAAEEADVVAIASETSDHDEDHDRRSRRPQQQQTCGGGTHHDDDLDDVRDDMPSSISSHHDGSDRGSRLDESSIHRRPRRSLQQSSPSRSSRAAEERTRRKSTEILRSNQRDVTKTTSTAETKTATATATASGVNTSKTRVSVPHHLDPNIPPSHLGQAFRQSLDRKTNRLNSDGQQQGDEDRNGDGDVDGDGGYSRGYDHDSLLRKALSSAEDDLENLTRVKESLILALQNEKAHRMRLEQENQQLRDGYVEIRAQHEVEVDALQYSVHHLKSQVKKLCEQGACLDVFEAFEKDVQRLTRENDILRETNLKLEWQFVDSETQMEDVQVDVVSLAEIAHTTNPEEKEVLERKRRLQQQWNRNGTKQKTLMERLKASGKEREAWKQEYERLKSKERQFIVAERMKEDTSRRLKKAFYDLQVLKKESEQQSVRLMEMDRENNILKHDVEQFQKSDELLRAERDRLLSEVAELRTKIRFFEAEESRVAKLNKFVSKHTTASSHGAGGSYARNENEAGAAINMSGGYNVRRIVDRPPLRQYSQQKTANPPPPPPLPQRAPQPIAAPSRGHADTYAEFSGAANTKRSAQSTSNKVFENSPPSDSWEKQVGLIEDSIAHNAPSLLPMFQQLASNVRFST